VLYSARGLSGPEGSYFESHTNEHLTLSSEGVSAWVAPGNARHVRLTRALERGEMQSLLEDFLTAPPANR
jgi:hypothetical protein